jgi:hypothetical protein
MTSKGNSNMPSGSQNVPDFLGKLAGLFLPRPGVLFYRFAFLPLPFFLS